MKKVYQKNIYIISSNLSIELYKYIRGLKLTFFNKPIIDQLIRSATAIGALTTEAECSTSKKELSHKLSLALKEAKETQYWLRIIKQENTHSNLSDIEKNLTEVTAILFSIVKKIRLTTKLFLIFNCSFLISALLNPSHASINITEVYPNPLTGESEWIEIHNNTSNPVSLNNWLLKDVLSSPSTIYQFQNLTIEAGMYYVAELSSQKLNNTADGVSLFDNNGEIIDEMEYSSSDSSKSWLKQADASWILGAPSKGLPNPDPTPVPTTTPSPSIIPSTTPQPSPSPSPAPSNTYQSLSIVSFLPCPLTGEAEYIVIHNNSSTQIEITNWKVIDKDDNYKSISGLLVPQTNTTISWSGSLLNNTGDSITVLTDSGYSLLSTVYGECDKGIPFVFLNNEWQQNQVMSQTSDTKNVFSTSDNEILEEKIDTIDPSRDDALSHKSSQSIYPVTATPAGIILTSTESSSSIPQDTLIEPSPEISKYGIINVIIGGSLVSFSGVLQLYDKIRLFKTHFVA